jgi:hypothetical protein
MKFVYLIMIDGAGNMRSTEDEPVMAFGSREEAERYLKDHTVKHPRGDSYCGGYSAKIIGVQFMKYLDNSTYLTHGNGD